MGQVFDSPKSMYFALTSSALLWWKDAADYKLDYEIMASRTHNANGRHIGRLDLGPDAVVSSMLTQMNLVDKLFKNPSEKLTVCRTSSGEQLVLVSPEVTRVREWRHAIQACSSKQQVKESH